MKPTLILSLGLLVAAVSPAALVSQGSGFGADTVTLDTGTGLLWLDLTQTQNISWDAMQGQLGVGGAFEGWRYATDAERTTLFQNAGIPNVPGTSLANLTPVTDLMNLLGGPLSIASNPQNGFSRQSSIGFIGTLGGLGAEVGGYLAVGDFVGNLQGSATPGMFGSSVTNFASTGTGHYLVQTAVPEPSTMALAALGVLAAAWRRRG